MEEPLQKSLERYDVLDRIAVGGMAEVFLAKAYGAHGFEKTLAIKKILPELARDLYGTLQDHPDLQPLRRGDPVIDASLNGALQDTKRAKVIGTQTFGKGSVQTIMPLGNNTAIKLTTARYYTPSGRSIQALGVTPDLIVEDPTDAAQRIREADLQRHLENTAAAGKAVVVPQHVAPAPGTPGAQPPKPVELGSKDDFQLSQAIAYLKGEPVQSVAPTLANTKPTGATTKPN